MKPPSPSAGKWEDAVGRRANIVHSAEYER
ncbi:hypothetical protein X762_03585 [Mesorhizobium sp. LSHC426A00]|nr:hypothetical protein X762_03585 [Mesorhizobium sp. LSHC426A00]ESZ10139.1 hypothetical protein X736_02335 [Mesorhizobium sp. L2C089B000]